MVYVFDTSSFIVCGHYFPDRFPSFWERLDQAVSEGVVLTVREVRNELDMEIAKPHLADWVRQNGHIFLKPGPDELTFVAEIFAVPHFQYLVNTKQILKGKPVADPFVIASAKCKGACVVTEESKKENAARIPNVCERFGIECTNLEGFMARESWEF